LIAAAAEELGVPVLHYDADFDLIASVTGQHCRWVLPMVHQFRRHRGRGAGTSQEGADVDRLGGHGTVE
jgi:hypothetical protein